MPLYLGIDGGGTGCRAAVADAAGVILGLGQSGPANIASNPTVARTSILVAAKAALVQAFGHADAIPDLHAGLGLAGANVAGTAGHAALDLPFATVRIETDAVTAAIGALGDEDGIVVALGTGSVFALRQGGVLRQTGGWGLTLGDEGSGAWLGRAALAMALRATDGIVSDTAFLHGIRTRFGGAEGVVRHAIGAAASDFAALAPDVLGSDDPAAQAIVAAAVADLRAMIAHLRQGNDFLVTFIGGLGRVFAARLSDIPQRAAIGTALDGALMLARGGV